MSYTVQCPHREYSQWLTGGVYNPETIGWKPILIITFLISSTWDYPESFTVEYILWSPITGLCEMERMDFDGKYRARTRFYA